jgi:hypothetical protein
VLHPSLLRDRCSLLSRFTPVVGINQHGTLRGRRPGLVHRSEQSSRFGFVYLAEVAVELGICQLHLIEGLRTSATFQLEFVTLNVQPVEL